MSPLALFTIVFLTVTIFPDLTKSREIERSAFQHQHQSLHHQQHFQRIKRSSRVRLCGNQLMYFLSSYCSMMGGGSNASRLKRSVAEYQSNTRLQLAGFAAGRSRGGVGLADACCRQKCSLNRLVEFC